MSREPLVLMTLATLALGVSAVDPYDRGTWLLEVAPVVIGIALLAMTFARFPLTRLTYRLLFVHALILIVGGYYTYARVPAGFWVHNWLVGAIAAQCALGRLHDRHLARLPPSIAR